VVVFLPAHDEEATVADVLARVPELVLGRRVECLVVDDGSGDRTAELAAEAGATVLSGAANRGLGAAVRTGLSAAVERGAAAVAFCDADREYDPAELERLVGPILEGRADYVVGSRFAGQIRRMLPQRRLGNLALTGLLRFVARAPTGRSFVRPLRYLRQVVPAVWRELNQPEEGRRPLLVLDHVAGEGLAGGRPGGVVEGAVRG
jgi:glycosyltransferase involved in cell wall biosynthesis